MSIELYTVSGWCQKVNKDDKLFSTFLEPYLELGEEMSTKIELTGGTAEVIEEEWDNYIDLSNLMIMRSLDELDIEIPSLITRPKKVYHLNVPFLHSLSRLSRILSFPEGWQLYVAVDERSPQIERLSHLKEQGKAMRKMKKELPITSYLKLFTYANTANFALPFLSMLADEEWNRVAEGTKKDQKVVSTVFYGIIRNALLRSIDRGRVEWYDVLWQDIQLLLDRELHQKRLRTVGYSQCTSFLSGEVSNPSKIDRRYQLSEFLKGTLDDRISRIHSIAKVGELYHRILSAYPEDIHPLFLGMEEILGVSVITDSTYVKYRIIVSYSNSFKSIPIADLPMWINLTILRAYRARMGTAEISTKSFPKLVKLLALTVVGREGLRRILLSLLYYMKDEGTNKRVNAFANQIEKYLESEPKEEEGKKMISFHLIDKILSK